MTRRIQSYSTYVVDRETGRLLAKATDLPYLGIVRDGHSYRAEDDPYPRVVRRPIRFKAAQTR